MDQPQLAALLSQALGERHEDAEAGAVQGCRVLKVDAEFPLTLLERVEKSLLELVPVAHDELLADAEDHRVA